MADQPATAPVAAPAFVLSERECAELPKLPDALRALADWHDAQAVMADAMDCADSSKWHSDRAKALIAEADRIQKEWEDG